MKYTITQYNQNLNIPSICSICLEQFKINNKIIKTICNHYYHPNCMLEWLNHKETCPMCRLSIQDTSNVSLPPRRINLSPPIDYIHSQRRINQSYRVTDNNILYLNNTNHNFSAAESFPSIYQTTSDFPNAVFT